MSMNRLISRLEEANDEETIYVLFANLDSKWQSIAPRRDVDGFEGGWFSYNDASDIGFEISNANGERKPTERQRRNGEMLGDFVEIYKITIDHSTWEADKKGWLDRREEDWDYYKVKSKGKLVRSFAPPDPEDDDYDKGAGGLDDRQMRER